MRHEHRPSPVVECRRHHRLATIQIVAQTQPTFFPPDVAYTHYAIPKGDEKYAVLSGVRIKGYVNDITGISRKSRDDGNQYWGRLTGSEYDHMTTDYVAAQAEARRRPKCAFAEIQYAAAVVADALGGFSDRRRKDRAARVGMAALRRSRVTYKDCTCHCQGYRRENVGPATCVGRARYGGSTLRGATSKAKPF